MSIDTTPLLPTEALVHHVSGEIDVATVGQLRAELRTTLDASAGPVVLDLGSMSFIDAAGLSALVWFAREMRARDRRASLRGASGLTVRVLQLSGVANLFPPTAAASAGAG